MGQNTKVKRVTIKSNRSRCQREDDIKSYKKLKANIDNSKCKEQAQNKRDQFLLQAKKKKKMVG
jgi:hypothetical protein